MHSTVSVALALAAFAGVTTAMLVSFSTALIYRNRKRLDWKRAFVGREGRPWE
jgi:uncharacterized membrane protein YfcA